MKDNLGVSFSEIKGLAIGQAVSASAASSGADSNQLLILNPQDQLQPADLTAQGPGNPLALSDTPKFVLVSASDVTHDGQTCASVLLRKSDSALFCVPVAPAYPGLDNAPRVQWDSTGDVVVINSGLALQRLELGSSDVTLTSLSFDGAELLNFAVNAAGDVMVNLRQDGGSVVRVYPRSGAPVFVTARHTSCVFPGLLGSNDFYVASGFSDASTVDRVEARMDGTYATPVRAWETGPGVWNDCEIVYRSASRLLVTPPTSLLELLNPSGTPRVLSSVGFKVARGESLFDWGQDSDGRAFVRRYDLPDYTPVELLTAAPYRLGKVDVSPAGEFTAVATRLSDGAHVVLSIKEGTVAVNELPASQPEIITLVRIR
ncbi:hypothetical protein [Hyalangium sp.]|uniref:hypothetical protein n=1 Tax=Hyalangium sp. TaxID=2028555 RepID=UPI00389AF02E